MLVSARRQDGLMLKIIHELMPDEKKDTPCLKSVVEQKAEGLHMQCVRDFNYWQFRMM